MVRLLVDYQQSWYIPGRQPGPFLPMSVVHILISIESSRDLVLERTAMLGKQSINASRFRDSGWTKRLCFVAFLADYLCLLNLLQRNFYMALRQYHQFGNRIGM